MDPLGPTDPTVPINTDPERARESNAGRILGVVTVFHFLALTVVGLRTYVRIRMVRAFGVDDGFIIAAAACALGGWICLCQQIALGIGHHADTISQVTRTEIEKIGFWETQLADGLALGLLRISMALSLMRLARDAAWFTRSLWVVVAFVTAYTIQAMLWLFLYCKPFSGWWEFQWMNPFDPRCAEFSVFVSLTYWNISCNIFTDICLGALPIPIILKLQMKPKVRFYIIAILNLGYVAIVMGVLKAVFMLIDGANPDRIFNHWVQFWKNLQLNFGLIAACASFLKPLLGKILRLGSTNQYKYPSDYYAQKASGARGGGASRTIGSQGRPGVSWRGDKDEEGDLEMDTFEAEMRGANNNNNNNNRLSSTAKLSSPTAVMTQHKTREVRVEAAGSARRGSRHDLYSRPAPDSESEEIILQKPFGLESHRVGGIVMTKEFSVTRAAE